MRAFLHRFYPLRAAVLTAAALLLSGCGIDEEALAGVWEGKTPDTAYLFHLQPGGKGRVRVSTPGRMVDYACSWSISGDRLKLSSDRGGGTTFRIVNQTANRLTLRVGGNLNAVCRLQRTGMR